MRKHVLLLVDPLDVVVRQLPEKRRKVGVRKHIREHLLAKLGQLVNLKSGGGERIIFFGGGGKDSHGGNG